MRKMCKCLAVALLVIMTSPVVMAGKFPKEPPKKLSPKIDPSLMKGTKLKACNLPECKCDPNLDGDYSDAIKDPVLLKLVQLGIKKITDYKTKKQIGKITKGMKDDLQAIVHSDLGASFSDVDPLDAWQMQVNNLDGIGCFSNLVAVYLSGCKPIKDSDGGMYLGGNEPATAIAVQGLASLDKLDTLSLSCYKIGDLVNLADLPLQSLGLSAGGIKNKDLNVLQELFKNDSELGTLYLGNNKISSFQPFKDLHLGTLDLSDNMISDLASLEAIDTKGLVNFNLENNDITDLNPLQALSFPKLKNLDLSGNSGIIDIQALISNPDMDTGTTVDLKEITSIPVAQINALKAKGVNVVTE